MPAETSNDQLVNRAEGVLEQGLRITRRRKLVFLQAVVIVPLVALGLSLLQEEKYTATAILLFREAPEGLLEDTIDTGFVDPSREAATNDELVGLPVIAERAARELGANATTSEVLSAVSVDSSGEADIAEITATTRSPGLSARMANAYGRAYIAFRREADRSQVQQSIDLVRRSLRTLIPAERVGAEGRVLRTRLSQLEIARSLQTGKAELVQGAVPPSSPSSPKTARNTVLGLIIGALLGFGLAALFERFDRRVRTVEELEELYGLPILARVPRSRPLAHGRLMRDDMENTPEAEAFRLLRTNLRYFNVDRQVRSIMIGSPEPGDGKSTIARNLATTMAEMGDNVILVEADLHRNGQHFSAAKHVPGGLSSVLVGSALENCLVEVDVGSSDETDQRRLVVLPSGPVPPNPSELLESNRMRVLLHELQERFEIVIIDSPALGVVSDALSLVPEVSGIVVVSGLHKTTRDGTHNLMKQLSLLGTEPIGVVANFTEPERGRYSHYYQAAGVAGR